MVQRKSRRVTILFGIGKCVYRTVCLANMVYLTKLLLSMYYSIFFVAIKISTDQRFTCAQYVNDKIIWKLCTSPPAPQVHGSTGKRAKYAIFLPYMWPRSAREMQWFCLEKIIHGRFWNYYIHFAEEKQMSCHIKTWLNLLKKLKPTFKTIDKSWEKMGEIILTHQLTGFEKRNL